MQLILYTNDHSERGQALSKVTPDSYAFDVGLTDPRKIPNLNTVTFWGHCGGAGGTFCDLSVDDFAKLVVTWKKLNPSLQTIEMISCNVSHAYDPNSDVTDRTIEPYATSTKRALAQAGVGTLILKSMPQAPTGPDNYSILLWSASQPTATWAYLAAPGQKSNGASADKLLQDLKLFFTCEKIADPNNPKNTKGYKLVTRKDPNFISLFQELLLAKKFEIPIEEYVKTGTVGNLRQFLVEV